MLTKRTGMFVDFANRSKAEVHSFTCFTPIKCHIFHRQEGKGIKANKIFIVFGREGNYKCCIHELQIRRSCEIR